MDCPCHRAQPTVFPDDPVWSHGEPEAAFFAAVRCGCGSQAWRVLRPLLLAPWERLLLCQACGREEYVVCPGWMPR